MAMAWNVMDIFGKFSLVKITHGPCFHPSCFPENVGKNQKSIPMRQKDLNANKPAKGP